MKILNLLGLLYAVLVPAAVIGAAFGCLVAVFAGALIGAIAGILAGTVYGFTAGAIIVLSVCMHRDKMYKGFMSVVVQGQWNLLIDKSMFNALKKIHGVSSYAGNEVYEMFHEQTYAKIEQFLIVKGVPSDSVYALARAMHNRLLSMGFLVPNLFWLEIVYKEAMEDLKPSGSDR